MVAQRLRSGRPPGERTSCRPGGTPEHLAVHAAHNEIVDLEGVEFIDSAGLGVLLGGRERAQSRNGDLVLVATGRSVVRVLELTGLTRVFEIHASRVAALGDR